jgi:hypothetical protein
MSTTGKVISVLGLLEVPCCDCGAPAREAAWIDARVLTAGPTMTPIIVPTDLEGVLCDSCRAERRSKAQARRVWAAETRRALQGNGGPGPAGRDPA